ncbi:hypothetical protein SBADM41S_02141 [Streptomyces badius]
MAQDRARVPLAHRLTYAAFLTATDAEARVAWHRWRGDYPDREQALPGPTPPARGRRPSSM